MELGTVYWFTGLSGSGKSTLGKAFYEIVKPTHSNTVFLDGDLLREAFGNDLGYSQADRRRSAARNSRLCKLLSDQGIHVVCATISLFHEVQDWNRKNIGPYVEIFVRAPLELLAKNDPKGVYRGDFKNGSAQPKGETVGVDWEPELPRHPDLILENDRTQNVATLVDIVVGKFLSN